MFVRNEMFERNANHAQAIILLYVAIMVPFRVGMQSPAVFVWYVTDLVVDLIFLIDIGLNFVTCYIDEEQAIEVMDVRVISRR